jgi:hypothetical protein
MDHDVAILTVGEERVKSVHAARSSGLFWSESPDGLLVKIPGAYRDWRGMVHDGK